MWHCSHEWPLVFTKLASQLTAEKLVELGVIPFIFIVQLIISYIAALAISRICKFRKRARNFVIAMAVRPWMAIT
jgi:choline kinase